MVDRCQEGTPTLIPPDAEIRAHSGGDISDPFFFTTVYVGDYLLIRMQHPDDDKTPLIASASLASGHERSFGPEEERVTPSFVWKKSTDWDSTTNALGYAMNSHTMRTSFPCEKANAIKRLLLDQWFLGRRRATARDVLTMARKLWNLTYVVRAGGCFVWRLLRLAGSHNSSAGKTTESHG